MAETIDSGMGELDHIISRDDRSHFETRFDFTDGDIAHPVLVEGQGPGIILMHELPGFVPEYWRLANWLVAAGFRVYAPALFETIDAPMSEMVKAVGLKEAMKRMRECVTREITLYANGGPDETSRIVPWLRALARQVHAECGGPGVGVIGLCLTGNFAWSVATDPAVIAPVAAEPSLPLPGWLNLRGGFKGNRRERGYLHLSEEDRQALIARTDLKIMGLRFKGDPYCPRQRFDAMQALIGEDRFDRRDLPIKDKHWPGTGLPHAVLTKDLKLKKGSGSRQAVVDVLSFMRQQLRPAA